MQHIQIQSITGKPSEEWLSANEERIKRELKLEFTIADCSCGARTLFSIESGVISDGAKDESLQLICPGCSTSKTINVPSSTQGAKLRILESWFVEELVQEPNTKIKPCRAIQNTIGPVGAKIHMQNDPMTDITVLKIIVGISDLLYSNMSITKMDLIISKDPTTLLSYKLDNGFRTIIHLIDNALRKYKDQFMTEALQWMNSSKSINLPLNYAPNAPKPRSFFQQYATNQPWPWSAKP